mmetsp:Transcript_12810/g.41449  ORF Transcript_12810/g.41449 Transcript_12810/m.41449 type:complete len:201 (-) Transcript_12810:88-690(-)
MHTLVCATQAGIVEVPHELLWRATASDVLDHEGRGSARVSGLLALLLLGGPKVQGSHRLHGTNVTFILVVIVVGQTDLVVNTVGRFSKADAITVTACLAEGGCHVSRALATDASTGAFFTDAPGAADEEATGHLIAMPRLASWACNARHPLHRMRSAPALEAQQPMCMQRAALVLCNFLEVNEGVLHTPHQLVELCHRIF